MEAMKDGSHLYEVERRAEHAARPGFRITELQISPTQKVPWHFHSNVQDTFYVINGQLRLFLREPKEEVRLGPVIRTRSSLAARTLSPMAATIPLRSWCCRESANTTSSRLGLHLLDGPRVNERWLRVFTHRLAAYHACLHGVGPCHSCGAACPDVNACAWDGARRALCRSKRRRRKTGPRHRTRGPTPQRLRAW